MYQPSFGCSAEEDNDINMNAPPLEFIDADVTPVPAELKYIKSVPALFIVIELPPVALPVSSFTYNSLPYPYVTAVWRFTVAGADWTPIYELPSLLIGVIARCRDNTLLDGPVGPVSPVKPVDPDGPDGPE